MLKKRLLYVDYVKGLAIVLVILGHINFANQDIKAWIYSFHMPLFFFVTGFVLESGGYCLLKKYFIRLMVPYYLWALIFAKFSIHNLAYILYGSYTTISKSGALTSLWFLPVMFNAIILFLLTKSLVFMRKDRPYILLFICVIFFCIGVSLPKISLGYPWSFDVSLVACSFMVCGNILRPFFDSFFRFYQLWAFKNKKLVFVSLLVILSFLFFGGTLFYPLNMPEQGYVLMANARYANPSLFAIVSMCGVFSLFLFCIMLNILISKGGVLSFVGQNTLCIFLVHKPIISCFSVLSHHVYLPLLLIITTVLTLLISCMVCWLINKYAPILVGKP